jgi:hypothetical protein
MLKVLQQSSHRYRPLLNIITMMYRYEVIPDGVQKLSEKHTLQRSFLTTSQLCLDSDFQLVCVIPHKTFNSELGLKISKKQPWVFLQLGWILQLI